jgi:hypothetical protein
MVKTIGITPDDGAALHFAKGNGTKVPEVAMKYLDKGKDAADEAARHAREWDILNERGITSVSQERHVEIRMGKRS